MTKLKKVLFFTSIGVIFILIGTLIFINRKESVKVISTPVSTPTGEITYAKVTRVIDGDTIVIDGGEHIRYIGMNTPELETNECYAIEASEINKELVLGKTVKLVKDVSETDKYGRLLRYVYIEGGPSTGSGQTSLFVDDYLVKFGAAKIMTVPPDTEFKDEFLSSQNYAKENNLGLWSACKN